MLIVDLAGRSVSLLALDADGVYLPKERSCLFALVAGELRDRLDWPNY